MSLKHDILDLDPNGQDEWFISTVTSVSRTDTALRVTRYFNLNRTPRAYAVSCIVAVPNWDKVRSVIKEAHAHIAENKPDTPLHGCTYYC